ncbi:MAG: DUF2199 domain-containing protein [Pseudomonadota bacterium]
MGALDDWPWACGCCGEERRGVPDLGFRRPDAVVARGADAVLHDEGDDICDLEEGGRRRVFLRAVLLVPLPGLDHDFGYGPWVELSRADLVRILCAMRDGEEAALGSIPCRLASALPGFEGTLGLDAALDVQPGGGRPLVDARAGDHPLGAEQAAGWSEARLVEVLSAALPCRGRG